MERQLACLRCGTRMQRIALENMKISNIMVREIQRMVTEGLKVQIYRCPQCGKLEFYK